MRGGEVQVARTGRVFCGVVTLTAPFPMRFFRPALLFLLSTLVGCHAPTAPATDTPAQLRTILTAQADAWNRGDVAAYMAAGYWQSDSLLFVGNDGYTRGYGATLARYQRRYPDAATMGQLTFSDLEMRVLSGEAAFVAGHWALARTAAPNVGGAFTLLFRRKAGRWVIVADHSS